MRILVIRGRNLASLCGEFEVRLDQPPISSCNLFCISGPTGSGKSTLLDALCLALYGRTPRLSDEGGHLVGAPEEDDKEPLEDNLLWMTFKFFAFRRRSCSVIEDGEDR